MFKRQVLVHPKISYQLVGIAFNVHNKLGGGLREKVYEDAFAVAMNHSGLKYKKQLRIPVRYLETKVCNRFLDFLVNDEIIVELKCKGRFLTEDIEQIYEYLKISDLQLGILINFGRNEVRFKRILNTSKNM